MSGALREVFARFGVQFDGSQLQQGAHSVDGVISRMQQLGAVVAGSRIVQGIREFASEFEESTGRLQDTADQLGTSTDELQEMQFAAARAGMSAEQSGAAFMRFQQNIALAARGSGPAAATFRALGVSVRDAGGHVGTTSDLFDGAMEGLAAIADPAERSRRAMELGGRSFAHFAITAGQGAHAVAALREEFHRSGGGVSPEAAAAAAAYGDALDAADVAATSLRSTVAVALLPQLTQLVTKVTAGAAAFVHFTRGTQLVEKGLKLVGAVAAAQAVKMALAYLPVIVEFVLMAVLVGALVIAFDELKTMVEGGDSALGRYLDKTHGVGTQQRAVQELRDAWAGLNLWINVTGARLEMLGPRVVKWKNSTLASVAEVGNAYAGFYRRIGDGALAAESWVTAPFVRFYTWLGDGALAAGTRVLEAFRSTFGGVGTWIEETVGGAWDRLVARVMPVLRRIEQVTHIGDAVRSAAKAQVDAAKGVVHAGAGVVGAVNPVTQAVAGAAAGVRSVVDAAHATTGFFRDIRDEWADIFNGHNQALAPTGTPATTQQVTAHGPHGGPRTVTTNRVTHNRIEIHAAPDPAATADHVDRRLTERERARRDAEHPTPGDEH